MKKLIRVCLFGVVVVAAAVPPALAQGSFTFTVDEVSHTFLYSDAQRTFGGIFVKPAGDGPFPAVLINHGQGGTPAGYSLPKAMEMVPWGLVAIGPTLTHAAGPDMDTSPEGSGNSPENLARAQACLAGLATLGYVDMTRVAAWGHSKGAYAAIGQVAALGTVIRAAAMSAGGTVPGTVADGAHLAAPTDGEAQPTVTPFLMFHGTVDPAVPPGSSERFKAMLDANRVRAERVTYDTTVLPPDLQHNLHRTPAINADMMARFRIWLGTFGVLSPFGSRGTPAARDPD